MKILIIQLSDIHFIDGENAILAKQNQIFESIRNTTLQYEEIFLIVTGDSAFSGLKKEFQLAGNFITMLKNKIEVYSGKTVHILIIPGNHDCNFNNNNKARNNQVSIIQKLGDSAIDDSVVEQCASIQTDYFDFANSFVEEKAFYNTSLLTAYKFSFFDDSKTIVFYCYNTAYISEYKEQPGKLFFPLNVLPEHIFGNKSDIAISLFHHPFNWFNPINRREFSTHISNTSDFFFTGHEHIASAEMLDDLNDNVIYHIEGSVLQDSEDIFNSEFQLVGFDLEANTFSIEQYLWDTDKYHLVSEKNDPKDFKKGKIKLKNKYNITTHFSKFLNDIGGNFTHPYKLDIKLADLYVYPKLRFFNPTVSTEDGNVKLIEDAESIIKSLKNGTKLFFFGNENIGKTALLKATYTSLYSRGFLPIYVEGQSIKHSSSSELRKIITKAFMEQYEGDALEDFMQEDIANIYIIIDDIDKTQLKNVKTKSILMESLNRHYKNIIIAGNELFNVEEIMANQRVNLYSEFDQYEILEFNYSLRSKIIKRWYVLGREDSIDDEELWRKCDSAIHAITIAMGHKIVPNYPIFLLILLQAVETSNPHDLQISSYGNYYQLLILKSLTDNIKQQADLIMYQNYCAELAYSFFKEKNNIINQQDFLAFHRNVTSYEKFDLPLLTHEQALSVLKKVGILEEYNDDIEFKYKYTYYYFLAKYLAKNINDPEIRKTISKICERIYRTEFANVVMFIIHFNHDDFIIRELLNISRNIFAELEICQLGNDIKQLQELVTELPKLYLQNKSIEDIRDEENIKRDEEENVKPEIQDEPNHNIEEDVPNIDFVSKLNLSFKLTEILGQIIKNNHGAMTGPIKHELLVETYSMGLRTLSAFFTIFNDNSDFILNLIKEALSKFKRVEDDKLEKVSKQILFAVCSQISFVFLKKISDSVGTNKMMDKYPKILEELNFISVELINFLIKLDQVKGFPHKDLTTIKNDVDKYPLSYYTLKRMVLDHLHKYPIDYKDKQRICQFLGIPLESQLKIESERKKTGNKT